MKVAQALTTKGTIQVTNKDLCALVEEELDAQHNSSIVARVSAMLSALQLCSA